MSVRGAQATLSRAASHWAAEAECWAPDRAWEGQGGVVRARHTANCLRELDGFLRQLLDELAPAPDRRQLNTANKLGALFVASGRPSADAARLRAIGRSAGCLFHCAGWVRRPDVAAGGWMTAGWPASDGATLRRYPLGDRLRPGVREVTDMCGFFLRVGEAVVG